MTWPYPTAFPSVSSCWPTTRTRAVGLGTHLGAMLRAAALADLHQGGHVTDERPGTVPAA
jgi:hypothetical protein